MATRFPNPAPQYFYSGTPAAPLSGGKMYFYEPGTTTPKDTYSDNGLSVANANPVILSSSGVLPNIFLNGGYRVNLEDKTGVQQPGWPRDSVNSVVGLAYAAWDSTITYGLGANNIVYASNGQYYVSIQANNLGHEPSVSPLWWQPVVDYFLEGQTVVSPGFVALGNASTGLSGLDVTAKGSLIVGDGAGAPVALAVGANTLVLTADSGEASGLKWSAVPGTAADLQSFSSSGTWTKPADSAFVLVELWSGGGGGANTTASNTGVGGGSGGEYVSYLFQASALAATGAVTIGSGGAGGANAGDNSGSVGGNTSFGAILIAIGGNPGLTNAGGTVPRSITTNNTTANAPQLYISLSQSGNGGVGTIAGGATLYGGGGGGGSGSGTAGGASGKGGAGGTGNNTLNTPASNGAVPSGGGGASGNNGGGGSGGNGLARVWTW